VYWAKAFTSKDGWITGVQFSRDGALLIGHSNSASSFIVVFNSATGAIQSLRTYSTANNGNYD
jgi:hypothetical protein